MKKTNIRWTVVALIFFATTINYIDRQVIGLLKPYIQDDLGWTEADYGYIVTAFQVAYGIGMLLGGRMLDRLGSKSGYSIAIIVWSIGAVLHATVRSVTGFGAARAILGLGEAGNFPAAVKVIAEWFPKRDRAYATGLFNSGTTIGAIIAPIIVTAITLEWGWRWAFIVTGMLGFVWVVIWWILYHSPDKHRGVNQAELEYIKGEDEEDRANGANGTAVTWRQLFQHRQTYAILFALCHRLGVVVLPVLDTRLSEQDTWCRPESHRAAPYHYLYDVKYRRNIWRTCLLTIHSPWTQHRLCT